MSFNRNDYLEIFDIGKELYLYHHARKAERATGKRLMDMVERVIGQQFRPDRVLADGFTGVPEIDDAKRVHAHAHNELVLVASPQMTGGGISTDATFTGRWHLPR